MLRTLSTRLALAQLITIVAMNIVLMAVVNFSVKHSLNRGVDQFLLELTTFVTSNGDSFEELFDSFHADGNDFTSTQAIYYRLIDLSGEVVVRRGMTETEEARRAEALGVLSESRDQRSDTVTFANGDNLRVMSTRLTDGFVLQIGVALDRVDAFRDVFLRFTVAGVLVISILGGAVSWVFISTALRGVSKVASTAQEIAVGNLHARVPIDGKQVTEISNMALAFNAMLDANLELVATLRDLTVNVAHDMRTPVTRIRSAAELTLRSSSESEASRKLAEVSLHEANLLEDLTGTMLEIAQMDSGLKPRRDESVDLAELLRTICELYQESANSKGIELTVSISSKPVSVDVNRLVFQRVVTNLLDNALKFTPKGGAVVVELTKSKQVVRLSVSDTGPGVPKFERDRVFDRFVRGDSSRSTEGHGLGLSFVRAAVRAHDGVAFLDSSPSGGASVVVELPQE